MSKRAGDVEEQSEGAVGFMASPVLAGEDQAAFDQLVGELRAQYQPEGMVQKDAVRTMAQAIWRKQRLDIFRRAAEARAVFGRNFRFPNDSDGVMAILRATLQALVTDVEKNVKLAQDHAQTEAGATPGQSCAKGKTDQSGAKKSEASGPLAAFAALPKIWAAMDKIDTAYVEALGPPAKASIEMGDWVWNQIELAKAGSLISPECFLDELRMIEQLDRTIDRCHDRLMKFKRDAKANTAPPKRVNPLTPGWAARRR